MFNANLEQLVFRREPTSIDETVGQIVFGNTRSTNNIIQDDFPRMPTSFSLPATQLLDV